MKQKFNSFILIFSICTIFIHSFAFAIESDELLENSSNIQSADVIKALKNFNLKFSTSVKIYSGGNLVTDKSLSNVLEQQENGYYHFIIENIASGKNLEAKATKSNLYIRKDSEITDNRAFRKTRRFKEFDNIRDNIIESWKAIFDNYKRFVKFGKIKETRLLDRSVYELDGYFAKPLFSDFLHEIKNCKSKIFIDKENGIILSFFLQVNSKNLKEPSIETETKYFMEIVPEREVKE